MKRIVQALLRRHENARLDRAKAAVIAIDKRRHRGAYHPSRPAFRREAPRRHVDPNRFGGPRYVRDGNLITLVPPFNVGTVGEVAAYAAASSGFASIGQTGCFRTSGRAAA